MPIAVGDIIEMTILGRLFGQSIVTTFPYRCSVAPTVPDDAWICDRLAGGWESGALSPYLSFLNVCPSNYVAVETMAQKVYPTRYRAQFHTSGLPGADAFAATTANVATSVERAAALSGRQFVGRISVPGLADGNMDDGLVEAAFLGKLDILADKMLNEFLDSVNVDPTFRMRPCIVHRVKTGTPPHWFITGYSDVIYTDAKEVIRTQRTRNIGKGA